MVYALCVLALVMSGCYLSPILPFFNLFSIVNMGICAPPDEKLLSDDKRGEGDVLIHG